MKALNVFFAIISGALISTVTHAETATCVGRVVQISNQVPNGFYMQVADSGNMQICNPDAVTGSITSQNCMHMASLAALAYATGQDLTVIVDNAGSIACDITSIPHDFIANIVYVGLEP